MVKFYHTRFKAAVFSRFGFKPRIVKDIIKTIYRIKDMYFVIIYKIVNKLIKDIRKFNKLFIELSLENDISSCQYAWWFT